MSALARQQNPPTSMAVRRLVSPASTPPTAMKSGCPHLELIDQEV
jgi:hypothetical protein